MRVALLQLNSSDDPGENLFTVLDYVERAAPFADLILTPEVTNCVSASRTRQSEVLRTEHQDEMLSALQDAAAQRGLWISIGSLAVKTADPAGRFANRSVLIGADGAIHGRYDKIHMFDVQISETETYHESKGYRPGDTLSLVQTPWAKLGMTICYDMRFPSLYRQLAQAGGEVITVPSAFSPVTGAAHWHTLLRARAIETGAFVLAPAQTGQHKAVRGKSRSTYGHTLVVSPWGEILADAGTDPGMTIVELDMSAVAQARRRIPSLTHDRAFEGP